MGRRLAGACLRPEFWLWVLLAWLTLSALRSLDTLGMRSALTEWLRWGAGIGLTLALGRWLTQTRLAAKLLVVCTGAITALGLWDGLVMAHGGLIGPFRDHQLCGSALLVLLPLTLATALTAREASWKWGAQAVGMAGLVCLVMTETRSAWIGAVVAGVTFAGLWWRRARVETGHRQTKQLLVPVLLFTAIGLSFVASIGTSELQQSLSARADSLSALSRDGSWQLRLRAWQGAEQMVAARPLTGWGLGQYPNTQWRFTRLGRVLTPTERPSLSEQAHDLYLQTTAETGLVGIVLFLAVLVAFGTQTWRTLGQATGQTIRSRDGFLIATLALIAGTAIDALASPSYQFAEVSLLTWTALGIGLSALNAREQPGSETAALSAPLSRMLRLATSGALALLLLSQFTPLGLLGPVEAYSNPTPDGYVYNTFGGNQDAVTYLPATAQAGGALDFTMLADYVEPNNHSAHHPQDVTFDGNYPATLISTHFTVTGMKSAATAFGTTGATRNHLTIDATETGSTLLITANYYIAGVHHNIATGVTVGP